MDQRRLVWPLRNSAVIDSTNIPTLVRLVWLPRVLNTTSVATSRVRVTACNCGGFFIPLFIEKVLPCMGSPDDDKYALFGGEISCIQRSKAGRRLVAQCRLQDRQAFGEPVRVS